MLPLGTRKRDVILLDPTDTPPGRVGACASIVPRVGMRYNAYAFIRDAAPTAGVTLGRAGVLIRGAGVVQPR